MTGAIRVFIVLGYRLLTEAVAASLESRQGIELVGATLSPDDVIHEIREAGANMILVDASIDKGEALELTREIRDESPRLKLLPLGLRQEDVLEFVEAGASGYVLKDASFDELLSTVEEVHQGRTPCSPQIAASIFSRVVELSRQCRERKPPPEVMLTPRETEVLEVLAQGLSNKEIAKRLHITLSTVKNHVHSILDKLGVRRRREAIRRAYEYGILDGPMPFRVRAGRGGS